jgi:DNA-binding NtrC family response regulator
VESALALTTTSVIRIEDIPAHLMNDLTGSSMLPALPEKRTDKIEREIIYRTLLDLKNDLTEIKELLVEELIPRVMGEPHAVAIEPMFHTSESLEEMERQAIIETLKQAHGNRRKTAKSLVISERTLYRKLKQYGLH